MTAQAGPRVYPWKLQLRILLSGQISCLHLFNKVEREIKLIICLLFLLKSLLFSQSTYTFLAKIKLFFISLQIHLGLNYTNWVNKPSHRSITDTGWCLWEISKAYCLVLVQDTISSSNKQSTWQWSSWHAWKSVLSLINQDNTTV